MKKYAALFVRNDSAYKKREIWDCYDVDRDALTFSDNIPVVCHPPCRAWGVMAHMAFRNSDWTKSTSQKEKDEKELAIWSIKTIRKNGGILEHPAGSRLFKKHLPDIGMFTDEYGGFTIEVDQFDFGHVAHKPTKIYICGIELKQLPELPKKRLEFTDRSIAGNVPGTKRCTQYQREYSPELLIDWFENVLSIVKANSRNFKTEYNNIDFFREGWYRLACNVENGRLQTTEEYIQNRGAVANNRIGRLIKEYDYLTPTPPFAGL